MLCVYFANSKSRACLPFIPAPRKGRGQSSSLSADHVGYTRIPPFAYSETPPTLFHSRLNLKFYKACTEQRTHHSRPVLGALPYSPRQLGNSHADWIFVRIRARSTNFASLGSSAYPQAERDPPPVLAGLRWAHFQWLSTRGKFEHQKRWRERARGLERGPRGSQVCQNMSRQPAAELRSYGRQLRRISLPLFPTPPSRSGWGRGGDVRAPPRPRLPGADRVLQLQSASQPVAAKNAQAAASFPAAVISLAAAVPTKKYPPLSSPRSLGAPPSAGFFALTTGSASQGPPLRSPPRLPHRVPRRFPRLGLQVMLFLFCS